MKTAEELIAEHHGFVAVLANRLSSVYCVDADDLIQQGRLGILRAMQSYDPAQGTNFLTYAKHWILQKMMIWVRAHSQNIRVPQDKFGKVRFFEESLHGFVDESGEEFERAIGCEETTRAALHHKETARILEAAIENLSPSQQRVIRALYFEELGEKQAAQRFGITRGGVSMAKMEALKKLRGMKLVKEELAA